MTPILLALLAGILTVAAPCTLPVLPILLGTSIGQTGKLRPAFIALGFVMSFVVVALVFSAIAQIFGVDQNTLRTVGLIFLFGFGLMMILPRMHDWLATQIGGLIGNTNRTGLTTHRDNLSGFVLGTTLGLVWTPCAGPILGSILTLVVTSADLKQGALLLFVYTIGAAIPMMAIAYGGQAISIRVKSITRFSSRLQQGFGVLVIGFAVAAYLQYDTLIIAWISSFYPSGQLGL